MKLTDEQKNSIREEYEIWRKGQYAGKSKEERQKMGQFYTPPELTIMMIEKFDDVEGTVLDPTCGCGGLLAGMILAGADPKKVYGIELDPKILVLAQDRLGKLGVPKENIHWGNALNDDCYEFEEGYSFDPSKGENGTVTFNGKKPKKEFVFGV